MPVPPLSRRSLLAGGAALTAALLAPAAASAAPVPAAVGSPARASGYVGTWAASPQPPTPRALAGAGDYSAGGFTDQTVRQVVHTSAGGTSLLLRFSNAFGTRAVTLGPVTVGLSGGGGTVVAGSVRAVTFSGRSSVSVPKGAELYSDPVPLTTGAGSDLAVSLHLPGPTGPATYHALANQTTFVARGSRAAQVGATGYGATSGNWYFLDGVDVRGSARSTVVALGDSITDGYQSTPGANDRWPDFLAQRLRDRPGSTLAVVNAGISGNRVLHDSPCFGTNLLSRLDRDVLAQDGASTVIMIEGINDIGFSQSPDAGCSAPNTAVSAAQVIAGYQQVIRRAHLQGLRVLGGTLTPFRGADYWSPAAETKRETVNRWIRTSGAFDGVVDFAAAIAAPGSPTTIAPAYDSGDHLHPNDAGYAAMAAAVDLGQLQP